MNKNSQIQDQARHCFHYQKRHMKVVQLKDVLIARQYSEKQSDVSKYTRWQQLKVGFPSVKCQNLNIKCKYSNEIFRQPSWTYEEQIQTTYELVECQVPITPGWNEALVKGRSTQLFRTAVGTWTRYICVSRQTPYYDSHGKVVKGVPYCCHCYFLTTLQFYVLKHNLAVETNII